MAITIAAIYRYPVKGLSAERLSRVALAPGMCLPEDRRFALARASSSFDPTRPQWLPKTNFLMLMEDEKLAQLRTRFDPASGALLIESEGRQLLRARITEAEGRHRVNEFFAAFLEGELTGVPHLVEAPGHAFADAQRRPHATSDKYVSLVNLASIRSLEERMDVAVDPLRFRANFYFSGADAWAELGWHGGDFALGSVRLRVVSPITRCLATHVNPVTAERDLDIVGTLRRSFGHINMGVYAEVLEGGEIVEGDELRIVRE
jgi:uncharacterized protein YcbX